MKMSVHFWRDDFFKERKIMFKRAHLTDSWLIPLGDVSTVRRFSNSFRTAASPAEPSSLPVSESLRACSTMRPCRGW